MSGQRKSQRARSKRQPEVPKVIELRTEKVQSSDSWATRVNTSISEFNKILAALPDEYGWRYRTSDAFSKEIEALVQQGKGAETVNQVYWEDTAKTLEAFTVMTVFRNAEILSAAVSHINRDSAVVGAILARSALETVVHYVDLARRVSSVANEVVKHNFNKDLVASAELEALIVRTVYASRLKDAEEIYSPQNILTIIGRVSKSAGQEHVGETYAELCEVTHPNFLGRAVFVGDVRYSVNEGDEIRILRRGHGAAASAILVSALRAVSWTAATQVTAVELMQRSLLQVVHKARSRFH